MKLTEIARIEDEPAPPEEDAPDPIELDGDRLPPVPPGEHRGGGG